MGKIYIVVGCDYEYTQLKIGFRLKAAAEAITDALNGNEKDDLVYKVEEVEVIE